MIQSSTRSTSHKVRYGVVGLGYIAQAAALPAFKHASHNSQLTALISDDPEKRQMLGQQYHVEHTYSYEQYEECLHSGNIDALYIAVPNSQHADFMIKAIEAGIHVLCEKPMATSVQDGQAMIDAANMHHVKLMIGYRLHFEEANLQAIDLIKSGKIGEPRFFISSFSQQVKKGDIRLQRELGGGSLWDMGIYCINAARYLFQSEPQEVIGFSASQKEDGRFEQVDEMTSAILRFPQERLATMVSSLGAGDTSYYLIVGTEGNLVLEPAYEFSTGLQYQVTSKGKTEKRRFPKRDQFAPEFLYFSDCILNDKEPEPSGQEGVADVRIIEALYRSARSHQAVYLEKYYLGQRPTPAQIINRPGISMPKMVHASSPSGR